MNDANWKNFFFNYKETDNSKVVKFVVTSLVYECFCNQYELFLKRKKPYFVIMNHKEVFKFLQRHAQL